MYSQSLLLTHSLFLLSPPFLTFFFFWGGEKHESWANSLPPLQSQTTHIRKRLAVFLRPSRRQLPETERWKDGLWRDSFSRVSITSVSKLWEECGRQPGPWACTTTIYISAPSAAGWTIITGRLLGKMQTQSLEEAANSLIKQKNTYFNMSRGVTVKSCSFYLLGEQLIIKSFILKL